MKGSKSDLSDAPGTTMLRLSLVVVLVQAATFASALRTPGKVVSRRTAISRGLFGGAAAATTFAPSSAWAIKV